MSLTSLAMIGLFAILVLLIARAKLREKDAEMALMATKMGLQNPQLSEPILDGIRTAAPEVLPQVAKLVTSAESGVQEYSFGDKPEDMLKPGIHTRVNIKIVRKKF